MRHIHVCLVSGQPIPNLTTVFQFRPDHVILLKTKEMEERTKILRIEVVDGKDIITLKERIAQWLSK